MTNVFTSLWDKQEHLNASVEGAHTWLTVIFVLYKKKKKHLLKTEILKTW